MPQLPGGDDLGANDELIAFKDEGEQEEKRNVSSERDLDDVKSSLVNESESSSDSEADRCIRTARDLESRVRQSHLFQEVLRRQQQDGGLFQPSPYVGYPFFMIPDLGNLCTPYLANAALPPNTRTFLPFQWPLLDVPGRPSITESAAQTRLSNSVPVVQHPHMSQLHPLLSYSPETFSPQRASPGFSPDTGMSRTPCYPVSPGGMAQIPHPLGWLQGQTMYPLHGGFSPAALAMNASMSSLVSGNFSPRMLSTNPSSVPHTAVPPPPLKHEARSCSQPDRSTADVQQRKEEKKPHIKKPLNAFMLYMREERPQVVSQCKVKESATINQILGQRWHSLSKEEQGRYYELARKERLLHSKLYPGWSARDNYGKKKKRKRAKSETQLEDAEEDAPPQQLKRPCVPPDEMPHTHTLLTQTAHSHPRSHLTHTHLSQASPASSLDSPATPTSALASPAAPAPTHTEHAHSSFSRCTPPYGEQLQPLALTTRPARTTISMTHHAMRPGTSMPGPSTSGPSTPTSSCDTPISSPHMAASRCSPPPSSFLVPPTTSTHQSAASSHGALFSVRKTNQL